MDIYMDIDVKNQYFSIFATVKQYGKNPDHGNKVLMATPEPSQTLTLTLFVRTYILRPKLQYQFDCVRVCVLNLLIFKILFRYKPSSVALHDI